MTPEPGSWTAAAGNCSFGVPTVETRVKTALMRRMAWFQLSASSVVPSASQKNSD
jgi:hypothetical protein